MNNLDIHFGKLENELLKIKATPNNSKKGSAKKSKASPPQKLVSKMKHKIAYQRN